MHTGSAESRDHLRQAIDDEKTLLEQSFQKSIQVLNARRNTLAPISRLPPETLAEVFSFLSPSATTHPFRSKWICFSHVCRRWRETALNYPRLWSCIIFSDPAPVVMAEMLAWAKMVPLHWEVDFTRWNEEEIDAFERQLEGHITHTRHLKVRGPLQMVLKRLVSSAPVLQTLSLEHTSTYNQFTLIRDVIPVNLFNGIAPSLTSLELNTCNISLKSPLLKGLQNFEARYLQTRPKLEDWLDFLGEMPKLESLVLQHATPSVISPLQVISEPSRTVAIPFLTKFHIIASPKDCALALAHLVMPALTSLLVNVESYGMNGGEIRRLIPYVARNVYGPQDTKPLRSILICGEEKQVKVVAWTMPDTDLNSNILFDTSITARLVFTATVSWNTRVHNEIIDALLMLLPVDSVATLTVEENTRVSKEFWLNQALRWPSLEQVCLSSTAVKAFRDMLAEDAPPDGPRLPSLRKLILVNVTLTACRTYSLQDMLIKRMEQGVPLDVLDLGHCFAPERAIQLLGEIVVDVKEPLATNPMGMEEPEFFNLHRESEYWNGVEFDGIQDFRYGNKYDYGDNENEDEPEYDAYDDDGDGDYDPNQDDGY